MKESIYKSYDELPLFLNASLIANVLGIAESSAYELMHSKDFPVIRIGSRMVVPKEKFISWVESQLGKWGRMNKRYFPMPYDIFNINLKMPEIALYSYLMSCENRKSYTCYPSYKTIARVLNTSENTVQKYVKSLEEKELISTEHTKIFTQSGLKLNGNLLYTIKPIQTAVDYFNKCQLYKVMLENQQNIIQSKFIKAGGNCDFTPN